MQDEDVERIMAHPGFRTLVRARNRFAWALAAVMVAVYLGFILLVAFAGGWLGQPLGAGPVTIGIVAGLAVVVVAFAVTGLYVRRANRVYDEQVRRLLEELT